MHQNRHFSMERQSYHQAPQPEIDCQNDLTFQAAAYSFPNDLQICKKYKSFKTVLQFNRGELLDHYTKRLSMLNRSYFTIKLKQIKREESFQQGKNAARLLLYYEAMPFSIEFAKGSSLNFSLSVSRIERILKEIVNQLIEFNIFYEVALFNCGFSESGEFRVFVPPGFVINEHKLTVVEKQMMMGAAQQIMKFWQGDGTKTLEMSPLQLNRNSIQFNYASMIDQRGEERAGEQEPIDVKKTIKLSRAYAKELCTRMQQQRVRNQQLLHELKKHKSMELIMKGQKPKEKKSYHFVEKINEINKKLTTIKETFVRKKSIMEKKEKNQPQPQKNNNNRKSKEAGQAANDQLQQNYDEEVIFDKQEEIKFRPKKRLLHQNTCPPLQVQQDCESVDTYMQEMGSQYSMPSFKPQCQMRKTALPSPMSIRGKNTQEMRKTAFPTHGGSESQNGQQAGKLMLKRYIQKSKEETEFNEERGRGYTDLSKISLKKEAQEQTYMPKKVGTKLKKMISLDIFENKMQTNSIHMSEYSKDLPNVKRRKEKAARNQEIKQKVQDILLKSKRAIELLRKPYKFTL